MSRLINRKPLTALTPQERTALVLRDNSRSRFSVPLPTANDRAKQARLIGRSNDSRTE